MSTPKSDLDRQRKWALLIPTPLQHLDPQGEPARQATVRRALGGAEPAGWAEAAHDAASADFPVSTTQPGRADRGLHPLSAKPLPALALSRPEAIEQWEALKNTVLDEGAWPRAWRAFVTHDLTRILPADPSRLADVPMWAHRSLTAALMGARAEGEANLLLMHLGPVGSFVNTARRTQDLWLGSYLVAFHAFQMMKYLADELGPEAIISPFLGDHPLARLLCFGDGVPGDPMLLRAANPNRLVAIVPVHRARALAELAAETARASWLKFGELVKRELECLSHKLGFSEPWEKFTQQLEGHLEIDAILQPWPRDRGSLLTTLNDLRDSEGWKLPPSQSGTGDLYGRLFDLAHAALGAGRMTDAPLPFKGDQRPKCSLTGMQEQMGPIDQERQVKAFWKALSEKLQESLSTRQGKEDRRALDLPAGDGLGAVALVRRMAARWVLGKPQMELGFDWEKGDEDRCLLRFPSVTSIATAPFRRRLIDDKNLSRTTLNEFSQRLDDLSKDALRFHPPGNLLPGLGAIGRGNAFLNHDGGWCDDDAYELGRVMRDFYEDPESRTEERRRAVSDRLQPCKQAWDALKREVDYRPTHYYAIVRLDGDGMGDWLTGRHQRGPTLAELGVPVGSLEEGKQHRPLFPALHGELSRRLSRLATDVLPAIVERYLGRTIYSGGDDLLAFLPFETLVPCLQELEAAFRSDDALGERASLSGGVYVSHYRLPLQQALEEAGRAEKRAKTARRKAEANSPLGQGCLNLCFEARSGAPTDVTLPWRMPERKDLKLGAVDLLDRLFALALEPGQDGRVARKAAMALEGTLSVLVPEDDTSRAEAVKRFLEGGPLTLPEKGSVDDKARAARTNGTFLVDGLGALEKMDKYQDVVSQLAHAPGLGPAAARDFILLAAFLGRELPDEASDFCARLKPGHHLNSPQKPGSRR